MSGEDRQSQLAQEHKERQQQREAAGKGNGKRNAVIGAIVALAVVGGGVTAYALTNDGSSGSTSAAQAPVTPTPEPSESLPLGATTEPSAAPSPSALTWPVSCKYTKDTSGVPQKFVGFPPAKANVKALDKLTITTNRGALEIQMDPELTPCSVNSMAFLAKKNFYAGNKCHRLVGLQQAGVALLQCGDPTAKADGKNPTDGTGTAGYFVPDEAVDAMPYTRGVVFMTQPEEGTDMSSSQFAISLDDANGALPTGYTPIGMVTKGLEWVDAALKEGVIENPQDIGGDGGSTAPKNPIVIEKVTVTK
ncbi:MAG: peptidylprolyl isomerase [Thermoactinospora sp.]|nr:peptidylprolyl isomerase [Thermoactinospora sp.]